MQFVDDFKQAWRWFSVQAMVLAGAVQGAWAAFGDDLKSNVPHWLVTGITLGLLAAGVGGRLVQQPKKDGTNG